MCSEKAMNAHQFSQDFWRLDNNKYVADILMDLSKAFNCLHIRFFYANYYLMASKKMLQNRWNLSLRSQTKNQKRKMLFAVGRTLENVPQGLMFL